MSLKEDIIKQFREQQQKYAYYIIALCVASIGFSISKTYSLPLSSTQILLGIAIFCWGVSIYSGLKFIRYTISGLYNNNELLEMQEGRNPLVGSNPGSIKFGVKTMVDILNKNSNIASIYSKIQNTGFLLGVLFFISWRIYEMYLIYLEQ